MKKERMRANFDAETQGNKEFWGDSLSALWGAVVDTADIAFTALMLGNSEEIYEGVSGKEVGSLTERNQIAKGVVQSATNTINYAGQVLSGDKSLIEMGTDLYEAGKSGAKELYSDYVEPFVKDAEYMLDDTVKGGMWTRSIEESYEKGRNRGKQDLVIAELLLSRGAASAYKQGAKKVIDLEPDGHAQHGKRDSGNRTGLLLDGADNHRNSSSSLKGGKLKTQAKTFTESLADLQKEVDKLLKQMGNVLGGVAVFRDVYSGEYRYYFVRHDDLPGNGGGGGGNHRRSDNGNEGTGDAKGINKGKYLTDREDMLPYITPPKDGHQAFLEREYIEIRKVGFEDVATVAKNTGLTEAQVANMKEHLFFNIYDLSIEGKPYKKQFFQADGDIAYGWKKAQKGELNVAEKEWFSILMKHELTEKELMKKGMPLRDRSNWDSITEMFKIDKEKNAHDKADVTAPNPPPFPDFDPSKDFNKHYDKKVYY
ncbi:hypothetical protein [Brevibacillus brevis]|uniref:hypothetical protein n=1 Tax=Brevibacillus brevis TaxID=1393 RepID=UPI0037CAC432